MDVKNIIRGSLVAAALVAGLSSAMAAPRVHALQDPWVAPIHLDSSAVPAKQYFEEMQQDGN
jgi:hypothetical protein